MKHKFYITLKTGVKCKGGVRSGFAMGRLRTTYRKGKWVKCLHPKLPFWLVDPSSNHPGKQLRQIATGCNYNRVMVVKVKASDITNKVIFCSSIAECGQGFTDATIRAVVKNPDLNSECLAARELQPLDIFSHDSDTTIGQLLTKASKKHRLPILPDWRIT